MIIIMTVIIKEQRARTHSKINTRGGQEGHSFSLQMGPVRFTFFA